MTPHRTLAAALLVFILAVPFSSAQDLPQLEKKITVHKLANGWTFIIYERPTAPVFSFATQVNVGAAQEVPGITGLAHMFEHMAFKGTPGIGTTDYKAEKVAIGKIDAAYAAYDSARRAPGADPARVAEMEKAWKDTQDEADKYIVKAEFDELVERAGGVGLNAGTGADSTTFYYSLPSNKTELFAYLESERFMHPVFREFYKERDVVMEERRMSTESQPFGRLFEAFLSTAFTAHPYHQPVIGYMSDLDSFSREDAEKFFRTYYVPSNMVTSIVGDVKASELIPMLDKYFGRIPRGEPSPRVRTVEPPQTGEKTVRLPDPSQPIYIEGYHKGSATDPDDPVFDVMSEVLTTGRTSRMYRSLVRDKQIAAAVQSFTGFPGNKYPNLFVVFGVPARGHSNEEIRDAIRAELEKLKTEEISDAELAMVKTRAKADLIRSMDSNMGMAEQLAEYYTMFGDWKDLFKSVELIEKVTKADIMRVAGATFVETNRTVGMLETIPAKTGSDGNSGR